MRRILAIVWVICAVGGYLAHGLLGRHTHDQTQVTHFQQSKRAAEEQRSDGKRSGEIAGESLQHE